MPEKCTPGRNKHSTFYHRDSGGTLVVSTYWNSDAAPNCYEQPWHKAGQNAPKGQCAWAVAIRMKPARNCPPTAQWVFIRTARCLACRPLM